MATRRGGRSNPSSPRGRKPNTKRKAGPASKPASGRGPRSKGASKTRGKKAGTTSRAPVKRTVRVTPAAAEIEPDGRMRLNRYIAGAGVCSRRGADELISAGRVTVNGKVANELGTRIEPGSDDVRVDGAKAQLEAPVYLLFNKPKDVVCTNARNDVRRRAIDFLGGVRGRIYTVGRLDIESEGLIILTNDGDFAQTVAHPRFGVPKTYAVLVRGRVSREDLTKMRGGVWLSEGKTGASETRIERQGRDRTYLKVTLHEGKNREIRRVFARLGYTVMQLKRVRIGGLSLHGLKPGAHRFLRPEEVKGLVTLAKKGGA